MIISKKDHYHGISHTLDSAGMYRDQYHRAAENVMKDKANKGDHEASELLSELSPAGTDALRGSGICAYIGARAKGNSHKAALDKALAKAKLLPVPTDSFRERHPKPTPKKKAKTTTKSGDNPFKKVATWLTAKPEDK